MKPIKLGRKKRNAQSELINNDSDLPLYEKYPYAPLIISIISLLFVIAKPVLLCILQWLQR